MKATEEFLEFIKTFLQRGGLKDEFIDKFLSDGKVVNEFVRSFTHKSMGIENYEKYETYGDGVLKFCLIKYIFERFPKFANSDVISKVKMYLEKKLTLASLAQKNGYGRFARYSESTARLIEDKNIKTNETYRSLLEDVFESLIGCTAIQINKKTSEGIGEIVCYYIVRSIYDDQPIRVLDAYGPVTRLKEIYDKYKWSPKENGDCWKHYHDVAKGLHIWTIYGYPEGDKQINRENRRQLAEASHKIKDDAKEMACEKALEKLVRYYGFKDNIPSPYEPDREKKAQKWDKKLKAKMDKEQQ